MATARSTGLYGDPLGSLSACRPMLVDRAAHRDALDQTVGAQRTRDTARTHGLHLAIAHAGQVGAKHVGRGLQVLLLFGEAQVIEAAAPRQTVSGSIEMALSIPPRPTPSSSAARNRRRRASSFS